MTMELEEKWHCKLSFLNQDSAKLQKRGRLCQRTTEEDPYHVYFLDFGFNSKHFFSRSAGLLILICPPQVLISEPLTFPS